mgnify:FL=1
MPKFAVWLFISALVVALDQFTKSLVMQHIAYGDVFTVTPFFDLILAHNRGAAFSLFADAGGWQHWFFSVIAVVASIVIIFLLRKYARQILFSLALSLVMGGALGNLIDRLQFGYVVDFLYFHYAGWSFPAFNVADSAITCGAVLLVWDSFRKPTHEPS